MLTQPSEAQTIERFVPSKVDFLKQIASGKSINKLEKEWKMGTGTLFYWVSKWGWKGIKKDRAQQLLDEMAIDGVVAVQPKGLIAINEQLKEDTKAIKSVDPVASAPVVEQNQHKDTEVAELKVRLDRALERVSSMTETVNATIDANSTLRKQRDDYERAVVDLECKLDGYSSLALERDTALGAAKLVIQDLESDRAVLLSTIEQASIAEEIAPTPKLAGRSFHTELDAPTEHIVDELAALISYIRSIHCKRFYLDLQLNEVSDRT